MKIKIDQKYVLWLVVAGLLVGYSLNMIRRNHIYDNCENLTTNTDYYYMTSEDTCMIVFCNEEILTNQNKTCEALTLERIMVRGRWVNRTERNNTLNKILEDYLRVTENATFEEDTNEIQF